MGQQAAKTHEEAPCIPPPHRPIATPVGDGSAPVSPTPKAQISHPRCLPCPSPSNGCGPTICVQPLPVAAARTSNQSSNGDWGCSGGARFQQKGAVPFEYFNPLLFTHAYRRGIGPENTLEAGATAEADRGGGNDMPAPAPVLRYYVL